MGQPWRGPRDGFLVIAEDEYDTDPPPAYNHIGPRPTPFSGIATASSNCRYVVRDTQRRRSFGIGGAGNIRTTREAAIVSVSAPTPSSVPASAPAYSANGASGSERRGSASGANDLRDKIVDGVKTILGVGHAIQSSDSGNSNSSNGNSGPREQGRSGGE